MKILLYTFYKRWGLCSRVVWEMTDSVGNADLRSLQLERYYISGLRGVSDLLKKIEEENYDLVIGLGDYRKDAKKIRFETKFINKYGRNRILAKGEDCYNADEAFLNKIVEIGSKPVSTEMQISSSVTNGPCNRSAYLILNLIAEKNLKTEFAFIHVPRKMEIDYVKKFLFVILQKENLTKSTVSDSLRIE